MNLINCTVTHKVFGKGKLMFKKCLSTTAKLKTLILTTFPKLMELYKNF